MTVLCLGLDETMEGEQGDTSNLSASGDKLGLDLPPAQQELLEAVVSTGKPVILVMLAGSALNLSYAQEHCAAIVQAWYPGAWGGQAVAELLLGKFSPLRPPARDLLCAVESAAGLRRLQHEGPHVPLSA